MGLFAMLRGKREASAGLPAGYEAVGVGDREVLTAMLDHGARLDEPRHVLHYVYVPDEEVAAAAADELAGSGWDIEVREPSGGSSQWLVLCQRDGYVLTPAAVEADRGTFERISARYGGEYDGWEASV